MQPPDQNVCTRCGIRRATNQICIGGAKSKALCHECLPLENPAIAGFIEKARKARCGYCGGSPCTGGTDKLGLISGSLELNRWKCLSCSAEYNDWIFKAFESISKDLPAEWQMEEIKRISEQADAHMKAFVRQRDN